MSFRQTLAVLLAAATLGGLPASAAAQTLIEGKHYTRVQMPQPTAAAGKVEVIEFFSYGCPHCADFEPRLNEWLKKAPADVHFIKVPAIFQDNWAPGARIYYTLEAMHLLGAHSDAVFQAVIKQRINLNDEKILFDWVAKRGIDRQAFIDMYKSFAVDGKVRKAFEMTQEYGFGGVPALIVGGKYMPGPGLANHAEMLVVADALIAKNRMELKK